ncbi:MAG TPA: terminase [Anaerolineae bacterium]|nr:terminase [Anaerolineae bacterium]
MQPKNQEYIDWDAELAVDMGSMSHDPAAHAVYSYPWAVPGGPLEKHAGPRAWQFDVLNHIGDHLKNPETRHEPCLIAIASGHGIGKSALIGMVTNWALDTCEDTRVVITANTDGQLRTKTAPEVVKWRKISITSSWFSSPATSIYSNESGHDRSWRCDFVPWSDNNTEAFAGLHNVGRRILVIMDEASSISDSVWDVVEGALTDEGTEIIWIVCGNPTRSVGRFRECFRKFSRLWKTFKIDSRTVEGVNKVQIQKWVDTYGEDSDFVKVRVRGEFPSTSIRQFIPSSTLDASKSKDYTPSAYHFAPKILTCDPAWTGDDWIVIGLRQGLKFTILEKIQKNDNDVMIANKLARYEDDMGVDAVFVDGGFGTGIVSVGKTQGRKWQIVWFSQASSRNDCVNKRAEMIVLAKEWLDQGGQIPDDDELYEEMCAVDVVETLDGKYKFAPKEDIREVIGRSPGSFDSLCLSFAMPVRKKSSSQPKKSAPRSDWG